MPLENFKDNKNLDMSLRKLRSLLLNSDKSSIIQNVPFNPVVADSSELTITNYNTYFDDKYGNPNGPDLVQNDSGLYNSEYDGYSGESCCNEDIDDAEDNTMYSGFDNGELAINDFYEDEDDDFELEMVDDEEWDLDI